MGSRRLGDEGWPREDQLEQSPILRLLQRFRHRGLSDPGARQLRVEPQELVGGLSLSTAEPRPGQEVPLGARDAHDLRLLHRQVP